MAEYIEREALIKAGRAIKLKDICPDWNVPKVAKALEQQGQTFLKLIKEAPTADVVEVKHGEWHLLYNCANEGVYCSVCHKKVYKTDYANQKIKSPFCPNCGAKMDLKEGAKECVSLKTMEIAVNDEVQECCEEAKAEAINEFAERYKALLETELAWCECVDEITKPLDNLVKEMVGAESG